MPYPRVIPHQDGAGVIEAVGAGVAPTRVGEPVWLYEAQLGRACGTAAEWVALQCQRRALAAGHRHAGRGLSGCPGDDRVAASLRMVRYRARPY